MAVLLGSLIGGLIAVYLLSALWEWALCKRIFDDPVQGKIASVVIAWITAGALGAFGMSNGGPYYWGAFLLYFIPALVIGFFAYRRGLKVREQISPKLQSLEDDFS